MEHTVEISSLVYEGYGFSRLPDGKAVFVPYVLPGEKVRIRVTEERKRHAYGKVLDIEEASPSRITPRCRHFQMCGGCHYQHIPYDLQVEYKKKIFIEQLQRMGGIESPQVEKIIPSNSMWQYRNTIQFHLTESGALAYMDAENANAFRVEECFLPMEAAGDLWPLLEFEEHSTIERVEIHQNEVDEVLMILQGGGTEITAIEVTTPVSIVHIGPYDQVVISGADHISVTLMDKIFRVSAGSFFQTNFIGAEAIVSEVQKMTEGLSGTLFDLFCGVGLFSSFLTDSFERIIGVEVSESACADFAYNLESFSSVSLYEGIVEKTLPMINDHPDCVIIDPPRRGMNRYAIDALAEKKPPAIIYVSCNPSTLARDVKRLGKHGYNLARSTVVDMFPQTYHIESVNFLTLD